MSNLNITQSIDDRKALAEATPVTDPDTLLTTFTHHWQQTLERWLNMNFTLEAVSNKTELELPIIGTIEDSIVNTWEADLIAAGYTVERNRNIMKVSIP